ncbi:MAG: imidazole glycerol phosphate synthase subunit HisH [Sporolactobacillus sp.]
MIGIVDYGMGNLYSLSQALRRLDVPYLISGETEQLQRADGLILPGVGAFKDAMYALHEQQLVTFLRRYAATQPLLGICLGMQLLYDESEEGGLTPGLSLLPGRIIRFSQQDAEGTPLKVPHMGWNTLTFHRPSPLLNGLNPDYVYFVHSYYASTRTADSILATASYGVDVPAIVGRGNVFGTQFHPEKSSVFGERLLQNYVSFVSQNKQSREARA